MIAFRGIFLEKVLNDFDFPAAIIQLILYCVTLTRMAVVWNGRIGEEFSPDRGLRQGCSLSPYLLVLCMEKLGAQINQRVEFGDCVLCSSIGEDLQCHMPFSQMI